MQNVLITGIGSGLGEALAKEYLAQGYQVYAIGRTFPPILDSHPHFFFFPYDLSQTFTLKETVRSFVQDHQFETVILNAGILGEIATLEKTEVEHIKEVMELNVWANKELIDTLSQYADVRQIVGMSSGASVNGSKGWGAYSLSKASLNMLLKVYAKELPNIHFTSLAPGVIRTPMVEKIINDVNEEQFPSAKRLKEGEIQSPQDAAKRLIATFPKLYDYESGSFLDVRTMA